MIFRLLDEPVLLFAWLISIILAITFHEFSHVLAADRLGDSTGRRMGRLTLNPAAHIDLLGLFMLAVAGFGWGRPAPYNPYNLRFQRFGSAFVALAGPVSNFFLVVLLAILVKVLSATELYSPQSSLFIFLGIFLQINLVLGIFNLIPIPPLDGSKLLFSLLPPSTLQWQMNLEQSGPMILLAVVMLDSFLGLGIFVSVIEFFSSLVYRFLGLA
ncbi:MAG: site-2 protease family protein [Patescibacteria group bacterium]